MSTTHRLLSNMRISLVLGLGRSCISSAHVPLKAGRHLAGRGEVRIDNCSRGWQVVVGQRGERQSVGRASESSNRQQRLVPGSPEGATGLCAIRAYVWRLRRRTWLHVGGKCAHRGGIWGRCALAVCQRDVSHARVADRATQWPARSLCASVVPELAVSRSLVWAYRDSQSVQL